MSTVKKILIVHHSKTGNTKNLTSAVIRGAQNVNAEIRSLSALKASSKDVLWCDGLILGTPENFGYMSGAMKHFLDEIYYDCMDKVNGLPYAIYVKAGTDGTGTVINIEKILSGLSLKKINEPVLIVGEMGDAALSQCEELGHLMAAGLEASIF